jgi:hypothetical protein
VVQDSVRILTRVAAIEVGAIGMVPAAGTDRQTKGKTAAGVDQEIGRLVVTEMVNLLRARASRSVV